MKKFRFYCVLFLRDNILQRRYYKDSLKFYDFVDYLLSSGYDVQVSMKYLPIDEVRF